MRDVAECRKNCNTGTFTTAASTGNMTEILSTSCSLYLDNKLNINTLTTEFVTHVNTASNRNLNLTLWIEISGRPDGSTKLSHWSIFKKNSPSKASTQDINSIFIDCLWSYAARVRPLEDQHRPKQALNFLSPPPVFSSLCFFFSADYSGVSVQDYSKSSFFFCNIKVTNNTICEKHLPHFQNSVFMFYLCGNHFIFIGYMLNITCFGP